MGDITFSVIIPAFNVAPYIRECIDSALNQTYPGLEVIVVDDCSTDGTADVIRSIADDRLRLIQNKANSGVSHSRNVAIDAAYGEYIVILDGDDRMALNRLDALAGHIEGSKPDMIFDDVHYFGDGDEVPRESAYERRGITAEDLHGMEFTDFIDKDLAILKGAVRKDFIDHASIRYEEGCNVGEDFAFYAAIFIAGGTVRFIPDKLYHYRRLQKSLGSATPEAYVSFIKTTRLTLDRYVALADADNQTTRLLRDRLENQIEGSRLEALRVAVRGRDYRSAIALTAKHPRSALTLGKRLVRGI